MITVIGAGRVGSHAAKKMAETELDDILMLDIVKGLSAGEALDISHTCSFDVEMKGSEDFSDMKGSDLIINTAGIARSPEMTSRLQLSKKNASTTEAIAAKIKKYAPDAVVLQVANPVDMMSLVMLKRTGFPRERVIGMGNMLDTMRFCHYISKELSVPHRDVDALVMGEHGESMVPMLSQSKVKGRPLTKLLDSGKSADIVEKTRASGATIIKLKGYTSYAPSLAIARMAEAIMRDRKKVMPTSVCLRGEYGVSGIFTGVTAKLGRDGMEGVQELTLDEGEKAAFLKSCDVLREKAKELGLL